MEEVLTERPVRGAMSQGAPFVFPSDQVILSGRPKGAQLLEEVMQHIEGGPEYQTTPLDFRHISFMDVSCADEILFKLLLRLRSGELGHRFVFLQGDNASLRETIDAVLQLRELVMLARREEEPQVLGTLKEPMRQALKVVLKHKSITSGEMANTLEKNVNIVCNRLNALQRMGLVCRLRDDANIGGGRQYYYVALL